MKPTTQRLMRGLTAHRNSTLELTRKLGLNWFRGAPSRTTVAGLHRVERKRLGARAYRSKLSV